MGRVVGLVGVGGMAVSREEEVVGMEDRVSKVEEEDMEDSREVNKAPTAKTPARPTEAVPNTAVPPPTSPAPVPTPLNTTVAAPATTNRSSNKPPPN